MTKRLRAGEVYVTRVADGRYAAVRIVRVLDRTSLVETCAYLDRQRPTLGDARLLTPVTENRFKFSGDLARVWLEGHPPDNFQLLGILPPTQAEAAMECNVFGGKWHPGTGHEAYLEWRWLHDRQALEEEHRQRTIESERRRRTPQKPKKMIDEDAFWSIIARFDWSRKDDDEKVLAPAIAALAERSTLDICQWQERLAYLLFQIDTRAHAASSLDRDAEGLHQISPDAFLYARCVAVASGREFYERALHDPNTMPHNLEEFESLLTLASRAYESKTGTDFDYETGCDYETFSNAAGWAT